MHCDQPRARDPAAASGPCPSLAEPRVMPSSRSASCVNWAKFDLLANQFSEILGGLHRLQAAIKADRRLNIPVSKQPPHGLVVPRPVLEIDRRRSMPELVNGDPKSHRLLNASSNLKTERDCHLRFTR